MQSAVSFVWFSSSPLLCNYFQLGTGRYCTLTLESKVHFHACMQTNCARVQIVHGKEYCGFSKLGNIICALNLFIATTVSYGEKKVILL